MNDQENQLIREMTTDLGPPDDSCLEEATPEATVPRTEMAQHFPRCRSKEEIHQDRLAWALWAAGLYTNENKLRTTTPH